MNPEENTTTPSMLLQINCLKLWDLETSFHRWQTNWRSIKDALHFASPSSGMRANRFCADHHHWMLLLPGTGLWHVVSLQSYLHATVTSEMAGRVQKSLVVHYQLFVYITHRSHLGNIQVRPSFGFKTSFFCFCATFKPSPYPCFIHVKARAGFVIFFHFNCSFGPEPGPKGK